MLFNIGKLFNILKRAFSTVFIPVIFTIVLLENKYIANAILNSNFYNTSSFDSLCYTIVIFILGIIITLKIKILENKEKYTTIFCNLFRIAIKNDKYSINNTLFRKNEFVPFVIFVILNSVYLSSTFLLSCIDDKRTVVSILLVFICSDFVVEVFLV